MRHLPVPMARFTLATVVMFALSACDTESEHIDEETALAIIAPDEGDDVAVARRALGLAVALRELAAMRGNEPAWGEETTITDAFPLYLPGAGTPSYYEYKVTTGDEDAGYIVVNVDRTDILVIEAAVAGRTLTESYREATGRSDLRVVRYDWFASSAKDGDEIVAAVGFDGSSEVRAIGAGGDLASKVIALDAEHAAHVEENGCARTQTRESLEAYYGSSQISQLEITQDELDGGDFIDYLNETVPISGSWEYEHLDHSFSWPWHMPHWYQPAGVGGYPVGCGPVAWAMVYAYWKQFHGKANLFDGMSLSDKWHPADCDPYRDNAIYYGMWELAELVETVYGGSGDDKWGLTFPWKMDQGTAYAQARGYPFTTCEEDSGTEWSKFQEIEDEIAADRPAILRINADGTGAGNHYVAIEGTRHLEQVGLDSLGYRANYGWWGKASPVWIYVQSAPSGGEYHSAFNAYYIHM